MYSVRPFSFYNVFASFFIVFKRILLVLAGNKYSVLSAPELQCFFVPAAAARPEKITEPEP